MPNYSPGQSRALNKATGSNRAALVRMFRDQNAGVVPGKTRDQKLAQRGRPRRNNVARGGANLGRMPRAQAGAHGIMPESKLSWAQTPATSNVVAPRGFGYYDAFAMDAVSAATHMSIGPATPITGTTITTGIISGKTGKLTTSALEAGSQLLIVMPGTGPTQARLYQCSSLIDNDTCFSSGFESPQLIADAPDNAIPIRCSIRARNWTQGVGVGGIIRCLRMTTGVGLNGNYTSNVGLADLMESIRTHARTRTYSGEEFTEGMQKNCSVVDQSKATWFTDWGQSYTNELLPWAVALGWDPTGASSTFTKQLHDPAYTPIAFLIEPFVAAVNSEKIGNSYEFVIRSQFLAHYAQGTMLANLAIDPANAPGMLNKHRDLEERKGSAVDRVITWGGPILDGINRHQDKIPALLRILAQRTGKL